MEKPVVLITGTSSGFGLLTAITMAKKGFQVIASMRDLNKRHRLVEAAKAAGVLSEIAVVELDVTDFDAMPTVVSDLTLQYGKIDVLINNAGFAVGGFAEEVPILEWRRQFETNVLGMIAMSQAVIPQMRERSTGLIINVGSTSGRFGFPGLGPYSASKFAVEGFSESLRLELARYGVRVVLVEPASYKTDVWEKGLQSAEQMMKGTHYRQEAELMTQAVQQLAEGGGDAQDVADLLTKIAVGNSSRFRYPIGKGVRLLLTARALLPWRLIERVVVKRFRGMSESKN